MSVGLFGEQKRKIDFGNRERSFSVGTDEWITPKWIIDALGPFDLDPCSAIDMPWKTANRCFTETDNGLLQQWDGFIWLNPPYGRETSRWMARLAEHNNGIALIFARTETEMFFQYVWGRATSLAFLKGRINFARRKQSIYRCRVRANLGVMQMNFDLEDTRRDLIAMRTRLGADTPTGHRCSNIVAQLEALKTATDPEQRKAIKDGIKQQIMELANLSGGVQ